MLYEGGYYKQEYLVKVISYIIFGLGFLGIRENILGGVEFY